MIPNCKPQLKFPLSPLLLVSAFLFGLNWSSHVIVTQSLALLPNHAVPTVSDASHNRWQHPYFVLTMSTSMFVLLFSAFLIALTQSHGNKTWKKRVINIGLISAIVSTTTSTISSAIFVESITHYSLASTGAIFAWFWVITLSIVPPLHETRPWANTAIRIFTISSTVGVALALTAVYLQNFRLGALGEYIGLSSIALIVFCLAIKTRGIDVSLQVAERQKSNEVL